MTEKLASRTEVVGHRIKRAVGIAACAVITGTGGALTMNSIGQTETHIGPATVDVGLQISGNPHDAFGLGGGTRIGLSDMDAEFDTHSIGPSVNGSIRSFDFKSVKSAIGPTVTTGQLEQNMRRDISKDIDHLQDQKYEVVAKSLGSFALGALGTGTLLQLLLWSARDKRLASLRESATNSVSIGAATALLIGAGTTLTAGLTYNPSRFASPDKSGAVATAEVLAKSSDKIRVADERNANTAVAVLSFLNSIEAEAKLEEGIGEPAFRIVVISDNHMTDPTSLVMNEVKQATTQTVLIDLGDFTNLGSFEENHAIKRWYEKMADIDKYALAGNHDQKDTITTLSEAPNTIVVQKGEITSLTIHGLRILAIGDPLYTPEASIPIPDEDATRIEEIRTRIPELIGDAAERGEPYDLVITHEPDLLDDLDLGGASVLVGHTHSQEFTFEDENWIANPGSTGGAGLRRFQGATLDTKNKSTPRSYTVLSISPNCQLAEEKQVSYRASGADDEYSVSKEINPAYDESDASTRCAS